MNTYEMTTHSLKGKPVILKAPVLGHYRDTGAPILDIAQMDDAHWEALAERNGGTQ